jgi:hypothetical protein
MAQNIQKDMTGGTPTSNKPPTSNTPANKKY